MKHWEGPILAGWSGALAMERCWKAAMVAPTGCAALDGAHSMSWASEQLDIKPSLDAPAGPATL